MTKKYEIMLNNNQLDLDEIQARLTKKVTLLYREQLTSTNTILQNEVRQGLHVITDIPRVLIAETQTAGRGQQGKKWYTPYGQTICMSLHHRFSNKKLLDLQGLSLIAGISVLQAISPMDPDGLLGLKWPNDILAKTSRGYVKVGGILVETWQDGQEAHAVIGIGITCTQKASTGQPLMESSGNELSNINQPWQDLETLLGLPVNRNGLIALIISFLSNKLPLFGLKGFAPFQKLWEQNDLLKGLKKTYLIDGQPIVGRVIGVSKQGELLFDDGEKINFLRNGISLLKNSVKPGIIPGVLA